MKEKALRRWLSNIEERLIEDKQKLQEIQENKTYDVERFRIYSSLIQEWIKEDIDDNIKYHAERSLDYLASSSKKIEEEVENIQSKIDYNEFIVSKIKQELESN